MPSACWGSGRHAEHGTFSACRVIVHQVRLSEVHTIDTDSVAPLLGPQDPGKEVEVQRH